MLSPSRLEREPSRLEATPALCAESQEGEAEGAESDTTPILGHSNPGLADQVEEGEEDG